MNKLFTVALGLAVVALPVLGLGVATADEGQSDPSCSELQLVFAKAQAELDVAVAADKAAAEAKAADEELARAERARDDAEAAARLVLDSSPPNAATLARIRNELLPAARAELKAAEEASDEARINAALRAIADLEEKEAKVAAAVEAQARVITARAAASADADRLADVAAKTDAEALLEVRNEARKAADEACGGVTTTPPTPTAEFPVDLDCSDLSDQEAQKVLESDLSDPHNLDYDEDGLACEEADNVGSVAIPVGGVNTGGGPA